MEFISPWKKQQILPHFEFAQRILKCILDLAVKGAHFYISFDNALFENTGAQEQ